MTNRFARLGLRAVVWSALAASAAAQTTTRVSVSSTSAQGDGFSEASAVSPDGRFVAFQSLASDLVPGDTNGFVDVFVHDRHTGQTKRVSVSSSGAQGNQSSDFPSISADVRFVAFRSAATLVPEDTNGSNDIFVHDVQTGETSLVSVNSSGTQGNSHSQYPRISADGRYVAFYSDATNLAPGDTNGFGDVFVHDRQTGETTRVSVSSSGMQGNGVSDAPSLSADGRFTAFHSDATSLVPDDTNGVNDVFVHDRQTGESARVSVSSLGTQGNDHSYLPSISANGRYVAFVGFGSNLVIGDTNGFIDIFVHDRQTGQTTLVSVDSSGSQGNSHSDGVSMSADGRFVAFHSHASTLVPDDTNGVTDVFIHDRLTAMTTRISVSTSGSQANGRSAFSFDATGSSSASNISDDGGFVTFTSVATNLVPEDSNGVRDVFIRYFLPLLPPLPLPADAEPAATAIANFDADALDRPDLAVVNAGSNSVSILLNNGVPGASPSFAAPSVPLTIPVGVQPVAIASADIDGVNGPDLAVANNISGTVSIRLRRADGLFDPAPDVDARNSPRAVALLDLDGDGLRDLLVARSDADALSVHRNLGGGQFAGDQPQNVPPGGRPSGVGSGDLDNDKDIDPVVTLTGSGQVAVHLNISPGPGVIALAPAQFFSVGTGDPRPVSVAVADFDSDGFLDVAVANKNTNTVGVLRNKGVDGGGVWLGFEAPVEFGVGALPVSIGAADIYGAGSIDLFTANAFVDPTTDKSSFSLLKNASTGPGSIAFEPERVIDLPPYAAHVAWGDVNLDGRTDVAVATGFDVTTITDSAKGAPGSARGGSHARGSPFGVAAVLAGASPSVVLAPCDGDANGDRIVDFLDLNIVLSFYGQSGPALPGDLDADEDVDFVDLNIVLSAFGAAC